MGTDQMQMRDDSAVVEFVKSYKMAYSDYRSMAKTARKICETGLEGRVQALFEDRTKGQISLEKKLRQRHNHYVPYEYRNSPHSKDLSKVPAHLRGYRNVLDIKEDVRDLAGVRIVIHYPHSDQWNAVDSMIKERFFVLKEQSEEIMFPGYKSKHYHVRINKEDLHKYDANHTWNEQDWIEIQVRSVVLHAWENIGHTVQFRKRAGGTAHKEEEEEYMLRAFCGLGHSAEGLIAQLWEHKQKRLARFRSKNDLGTFLEEALLPASKSLDYKETDVLRTELYDGFDGTLGFLRKCLAKFKMDTPAKLRPILNELNFLGPEDSVRKRIDVEFRGYTLKPSIYIVQHMLNAHKDQQQYEFTIQSSYQDKCKVLISAFIWMHKLFLEFSLMINLLRRSSDGLLAFRWSIDFIYDSPSRISILNGAKASPEHEREIDILWHLFEVQTARPIAFVFDICRLGVLEELPRNIGRMSSAGFILRQIKGQRPQ